MKRGKIKKKKSFSVSTSTQSKADLHYTVHVANISKVNQPISLINASLTGPPLDYISHCKYVICIQFTIKQIERNSVLLLSVETIKLPYTYETQ